MFYLTTISKQNSLDITSIYQQFAEEILFGIKYFMLRVRKQQFFLLIIISASSKQSFQEKTRYHL